MIKQECVIPKATAKRLPLYYRFLKNIHGSGKERISSSELSEALKIDSATIRRDFSYFGALGKKGYGYNVAYMLTFFAETLYQNEMTKVALIGVGNLGTALINYNFSKNNNTKIAMAFDVDPNKLGEIQGIPVYHLDELKDRLDGIEVAILTVPSEYSQDVANKLADSSIEGILNFTPTRIHVPKHIRVHHIDLTVELQSLIYFLKNYN